LYTIADGEGSGLGGSLELYEIERLDFAEAYLIASAEATGVKAILSFDRAIDSVKTVARIEP